MTRIFMKISIDKIILVTALHTNEIQRIINKYPNRKNSYFHYSYFQKKPSFFAVFIQPRNYYVLRHYNTLFSFNPTNPPVEALDIFKMIPAHRWMVKRLDIAFDFVTPLEETFLLAPPTRLQKKRVGDTQYFGAVNSKMKVCLYNKSKQLKDVYGITSIYPLTRVEFRFTPKLKPLTDYSHLDFKGMKNYYFVPNTRELRGFR
ncbi:hypothetical protein [Brevibacillus marinus]|uniref:hypothetical protein n=1 Tax=Brevibacillus marinus TaxID=2496837 RepID=UPI000F82A15B|nr:hypothetical protein [Brevibacillus marinus]